MPADYTGGDDWSGSGMANRGQDLLNAGKGVVIDMADATVGALDPRPELSAALKKTLLMGGLAAFVLWYWGRRR